MRAITYSEFGDSKVLRLGEVDRPKVGPSEVLIRVERAAVNPVDWKIMGGHLDQLMDAVFPVIPGWDVAGVIEEVGPDVPEFVAGDRVAAYARKMVVSGGTFAEFVTVNAKDVAPVPDGVEFDVAAALPLAGLTARRSINALGLGPDDVVLLHAASGGVGFVAAQLAVRTGARVIGTASEANAEKLRAIGVEPVVYGDGLVDRVRELLGGEEQPINAVADFVGGVQKQTDALLKNPSRQVSIADPEVIAHGGRWIWVRPDGDGLLELLQLVDSGDLRLEIDRVFPLGEVADAFAVSESGQAKGKLVIDVTR